MTPGEREMVRKLEETEKPERFTSLQPTYEDSVPPDSDDTWDLDEHS